MAQPTLNIIIASTRPGRIGPSIGRWFETFAREHAGFEVNLVDLADFNLPIYNEPAHPRAQQYVHDHTKRWSASVDAADAFVFVTPEYNFGPPPGLINALDYLATEWNYKPCGFVSYGGLSGGMRAVQAEKLHVTTLKMMPMLEAVAMPMVFNQIDADGVFHSNELIDDSAQALLDELLHWAHGLRAMREPSAHAQTEAA